MSKYILTTTEVKYLIKALAASSALEFEDVDHSDNESVSYYSGYSEGIELAITMLKNIDKNSTGVKR